MEFPSLKTHIPMHPSLHLTYSYAMNARNATRLLLSSDRNIQGTRKLLLPKHRLMVNNVLASHIVDVQVIYIPALRYSAGLQVAYIQSRLGWAGGSQIAESMLNRFSGDTLLIVARLRNRARLRGVSRPALWFF
ncbi:hypothetical protein JI435_411600 [Parastagonospora nodorum SN15]|uniref:Uncharacterized protein n=1 Tax=Phaeosphaeria nodorum (strain SN15 / ATCC MYA-4574 / FGSC 10173) TaxID=321614 RepID=A0A7U2I3M0_PHANO|nr:hypothetical protein JI435_411600 [Parastagonospora nodorum SN15]